MLLMFSLSCLREERLCSESEREQARESARARARARKTSLTPHTARETSLSPHTAGQRECDQAREQASKRGERARKRERASEQGSEWESEQAREAASESERESEQESERASEKARRASCSHSHIYSHFSFGDTVAVEVIAWGDGAYKETRALRRGGSISKQAAPGLTPKRCIRATIDRPALSATLMASSSNVRQKSSSLSSPLPIHI